MSWKTVIALKNNTDNDVLCVIPPGQVFENKKSGSGIQNMAATREYKLVIPAQSRLTVEIDVCCMNRKLSPPSGVPGNVTIFKIDRPYSTQNELWTLMSNPKL